VRRRRRVLSLTPLVDVIFLLLLFFMLGSTFLRHGEIELGAAAAGPAAGEGGVRFLRVGEAELLLGAREVTLDGLAEALGGSGGDGGRLLVGLRGEVGAQRLVDVLARLRTIPNLDVTVLR
jgi:biopolymer transport protein ExbD